MGISSLFYGLFKLESGTGCENTFPDGTGSREKERVYVEKVWGSQDMWA